MNLKILVASFLVILLPLIAICQDTTFLDKSYLPVSRENASYYQLGQDEGDLYIRKVFTINQRLSFIMSHRSDNRKIKEGVFVYYHENGAIRRKTTYKNDKRDGVYETYFDNGQLSLTGQFINDKSSGLWKTYYNNGTLKREKRYQEGVPSGRATGYFRDGKPKYIASFNNGVFHLQKAFQSNGTEILSEGEGKWLSYFDSSTVVFQKGSFQNGYREGEWQIFYRSTQKPLLKITFEKGVPKGNISVFDSTGNIIGLVNSQFAKDFGGINSSIELQPQPLNMAEVKTAIGYPQIAIDAGIEGNVIVRLLVDRQGQPIDYRLLTQVHPILSRAVEAHILETKFIPAIQGSQPIKFWVNIPFNFKLLPAEETKKKKKRRRKN